MGIRFGGSVGPVYASTDTDDAAGCLRGLLIVGALCAAAVIALAFVKLILPVIIGVGVGLWLIRNNQVVVGLILLGTGIWWANHFWPPAYEAFKYNETVPDVAGITVDVEDAVRKLERAGFTNVEVVTEGSGGTCWVDGTRPEGGTNMDRRDKVTLVEVCSRPSRR